MPDDEREFEREQRTRNNWINEQKEHYNLTESSDYALHIIYGDLREEPLKGWHCPRVGNFQQRSERRYAFSHYIDEMVKNEYTPLPGILSELTENLERYQREVETIDEKINKWIKIEAFKQFTNITDNSCHLAGIEYMNFHCPKCGHDLTKKVTEIETEYQIEPKKEIPKYPKIRISEMVES